MKKSFISRLSDAVAILVGDPRMKCAQAKSNCLYTPLYRSGKYVWAKVFDSDGTLISSRPVHSGEGAASGDVRLLLGAVIQSEDSTSQTKPNPLGKAALPHVPNGIWADMSDGERRRFDRVVVVFVLPKGAAAKHKKPFETARRNVLNASDIMTGAVTVEVPRGAGADDIASAIGDEIRPFLVGKGRPRSEA
jgi:hypothetical protein